ncbi:hypothetical protein [Nocardia farcinica]|uniref:hypothetical protein n=1 Tax=Nocardia farcinica TaxID=37329 RepID=UPI002458449E|nr:hypothetical protein [Nocardia farcinica]
MRKFVAAAAVAVSCTGTLLALPGTAHAEPGAVVSVGPPAAGGPPPAGGGGGPPPPPPGGGAGGV